MHNNLLLAQPSDDKLYVEDVFSTYLYTGNGGTQTITNGIDLAGKGGLVWIKSRSQSTQHCVLDSARGVAVGSAVLNTASTSPASDDTYNPIITSLASTGFNLGQGSGFAASNQSGQTYTSWTFRKSPKFFDVVTYTGNSTANRKITHSLGTTPGMIIVKDYGGSGAGQNWRVWHRSANGGNAFLTLNLTNAINTDNGLLWGDGNSYIAPTSTDFTISGQASVNGSGIQFVAYVFAHDTTADGVIQCGSFMTDAIGNATVNLGYEPQFILTKASSNTGDWNMFDVMRGMPASPGAASTLCANSSSSESGATWGVNPTATGFTVVLNGFTNYIYMAIRRGPMRTPTDATKVFTPAIDGANNTPAYVTPYPPDMLFSKWPGGSGAWQWADRLRGNKELISTSADAESTNNFVTMYQNGAFSIFWNTYKGWAFRRAPGFFDTVCYQANGTSGRQINHGLGVAPELMIIKDRSASGTWAVYTPLGALGLNASAGTSGYNGAAFFGNNTNVIPPTASVFTVGTSMNWSTNNFVAYLFASCPGVSKVGSYTGTGAGVSNPINCGFTNGARFVLIKRTDSTGDWYVFDTVRGIINGNDPLLRLNTTAGESTGIDALVPYSLGFDPSDNSGLGINASGGTYIYLAIA